MASTHWLPEGNSVVSPYLIAHDVAGIIAFAKETFGATESFPPHMRPDGTIGHAQIKIGDSCIMLGEAQDEFPAMPCMIHVYIEDIDEAYDRALKAGATTVMEPSNQFYGDRSAGVKDKSGNLWWMAKRVEDVPHDELNRRMAEAHEQREQK